MKNNYAIFRYPGDEYCLMVSRKDGGAEELRIDDNPAALPGFILAPFHLDGPHPIIRIRSEVVERMKISENLPQPCKWTADEKDEHKHYHTAFTKFHERLKNESFDKLVLSRRLRLEADCDFDSLNFFFRACILYPDQFVALVKTQREGTWLMATPETLIKKEGDEYTSMALAGTRRGRVEQWDKKNIREQDIVRKYIERQLLPVCSKVEHGRLVTQTAGELSHLRTDFRFRPLKGTGLSELASRLHPTPAVCGLPKEEAQKFILSAETHDRAYYSGFAGPVDVEGTTHLFVNLRCLCAKGRHCTLYAGGGLLKESIEEKEWIETEEKLKTMKKCIATKEI